MHAFWQIVRTELRLMGRDLTNLSFIVFFPAVMALVLGLQMPAGPSQTANALMMLAFGPMIFGIMAFPMSLVNYRERGMLRRLQITPISPLRYLLAQALVGLLLVLLGGLVVLILSVVVLKLPLPANPLGLIASFLVGAIAFSALGALLGSRIRNTRSIQVVSILVFGAMAVVLVSSTTSQSGLLQQIGAWVPARHLVQLIEANWLGLSFNIWPSLAVLALLTVVSLGSATKLFRWE